MNRPARRDRSRQAATRTAGAVLLACAVLLAAAGPAEGRPPVSFVNEEVIPELPSIAPAAAGASTPFARVRYQEGGVESRQGNALPQAVDVNYPVFAGERIVTDSGQRAELQFPDGTLLRIDREHGGLVRRLRRARRRHLGRRARERAGAAVDRQRPRR